MNETPDANKCGCRNLRCCGQTGHKPAHVAALSQQSFGLSAGNTTRTVPRVRIVRLERNQLKHKGK